MIKPEQNPRGPGVLEAPKGLIKGSSAENDLNKISHDLSAQLSHGSSVLGAYPAEQV